MYIQRKLFEYAGLKCIISMWVYTVYTGEC